MPQQPVLIIDYHTDLKLYFESLNKAWITKYFSVEPLDEEILTNPQSKILDVGGFILFAKLEEAVVGTVAMKFMDDKTFELTKLGVDEAYQGIGAGKKLCVAAIERVMKMGAKKIVLSTESRLHAAIGLYKKLGFIEVPITATGYSRVDMMMELRLG